MAIQYVDPALPRHIFSWRSPRLGIEMPIVTYGNAGVPLLLFPTAAADFLENERFFLVKAIEPFIFDRRVRLFSIDSINAHAWMDRTVPIPEKARRQALYSSYIEEEVVPYIRHVTGDAAVRSLTTGASFGAFHAANAFFRRPDLFSGTIAMSGFFDLSRSYLDGYHDDNVYFNNPAYYLPNLEGRYLELLQRESKVVIVTGQGAYEAPDNSRRLSQLLHAKAIAHVLDVWGFDVRHDWPAWRKMLPYHLQKVLGS
ncbi:MAG TPA: alpha/beta hydrolase-fold protein [Gemmatimonadaceae bacterium]|nr:alpha/beta hydrolase-fold protein [Gemmatimonadaceae bacterium]